MLRLRTWDRKDDGQQGKSTLDRKAFHYHKFQVSSRLEIHWMHSGGVPGYSGIAFA